MTELTVTALRLGFVVLLWVFVLGVVAVVRRDVAGAATRRPAPRARAAAPARPAAPTAAPPPPPIEDARRLLVIDGPSAGRSLPLGPAPVLLGRGEECTVALDDEYASTRHARLSRTDRGWVLEDLQSTNGTFVGEEQVTSAVLLGAGDRFRVGKTTLELRS